MGAPIVAPCGAGHPWASAGMGPMARAARIGKARLSATAFISRFIPIAPDAQQTTILRTLRFRRYSGKTVARVTLAHAAAVQF
jgi:hypothetical protein